MQPAPAHSPCPQPLLPPGYRFHPTDEELIVHYLLNKTSHPSFHASAIAEVDLNRSEPWDLPGKADTGEQEWYFFSLRDRKYPTGLRTNRATGAGYWKATGKDREVVAARSGDLVGMKKTLVFYVGRAPKGEKTSWIMHEYRLEGDRAPLFHFSKLCKEEWVVCRVFRKSMAGRMPKSKPCLNVRGSCDEGHYSLPPLLDSPHAAAINVSDQHDPPPSSESVYGEQAFAGMQLQPGQASWIDHLPLDSLGLLLDQRITHDSKASLPSLCGTLSADHLLPVKDYCRVEPYVGGGAAELGRSRSFAAWMDGRDGEQRVLPLQEVANLICMSSIAGDDDLTHCGETEASNAFSLIRKYAAEHMGGHGSAHILSCLWA